MNESWFLWSWPTIRNYFLKNSSTNRYPPSLKLISIAPENRSSQKWHYLSSKHQFSGAMLVSFSERRTWTFFFAVQGETIPELNFGAYGLIITWAYQGVSWGLYSRHPFSNKNVILVVTIAFCEVHTPQVTSWTGILLLKTSGNPALTRKILLMVQKSG